MLKVVLASQVLEGLSLGLWDEEGSEDTGEHKGGVDLHDMVEPWVGASLGRCTTGSERSDSGLGDDGAQLTGGSRDTVGGGTIAGWEALAGNNEGGRIGACRLLVTSP